jgi:Domain of unknown function (DUF4375)
MPGRISALFRDYELGTLGAEPFHDALSLAIPVQSDSEGRTYLSVLPDCVRTYYAAWAVSADVLNGGFAQAAFNNPQFFDDARLGFENLGLTRQAELIAKAQALIAKAEAKFKMPISGDIGEHFEEFLESRLSKLDDELGDLDFWPIEQRTAYAVEHIVCGPGLASSRRRPVSSTLGVTITPAADIQPPSVAVTVAFATTALEQSDPHLRYRSS